MKADIVFINGVVYSITMDDRRINGTAVAVQGEKIQAVGTDEEVKQFIGENTKVIDCKGNTILPGLCDAHCHPSWAASVLVACDLFNVRMTEGKCIDDVIAEYLELVKAYIEKHPDEKIIRGAGWDYAFFNGAHGEIKYPTRHDLDKICSDKAIVLESYCQHHFWTNTKAIVDAGLDENTKSPETGVIDREENGFPSGTFHEMEALDMIRKGLPGYDYSVEKYKEILRRYQKELANIYGIVMVNDCLHGGNATEAYRQLADAGELTLRARGVYHVQSKNSTDDCFEDLLSKKAVKGKSDDFAIETVKIFLDGDMCMCEPWEPGITEILGVPKDYRSHTLWTEEEAKEFVARAIENGFQLHIHAMGDQAVKLGVESLEIAQTKYPGDHRNAIAHVMAIKPEDIEKMGKHKIIAAMQPAWMVNESTVDGFYIPYFGKERTLLFYPNKRLLDAGAIVTYGSDFPITPPPNPWHGIQCALTRAVFVGQKDYNEYKGKVLGPEGNETLDCVTLDDAIKCSTITGAYQNRLEDVTGSLEVGKSADIVLINVDIEKTPVEEIYDIQADVTMFKGKIVHSRM